MEFEKFKEQLSVKLNDYFIEKSFSYEIPKQVFVKADKAMKDVVSIRYGENNLDNVYRVSISGSRKFELIESIWEDLSKSQNNTFTIGSGIEIRLTTIEINYKDSRLLWKANDFITKTYELSIKKQLDFFSNIKILDAILNSTIENKDVSPTANLGFWHRKLIVAKLSGNIQFEQIYKFGTEQFKKTIKNNPNNLRYNDVLNNFNEVYLRLKKIDKLENPELINYKNNLYAGLSDSFE